MPCKLVRLVFVGGHIGVLFPVHELEQLGVD
jgi:hypothetical protein